jgi:GNAT superfamily N-acetyltransferase
MLTQAFDESPLFQLAFPRAERRRQILRNLFTAVVKDAVRFGYVECAYNKKITGMLIWYPPGAYPMPLRRVLRFLPHYVRMAAIHPIGVFKLFRAQATLNELRPKQRHCHGYFLGGLQGGHIGSMLIRRVLKEVDERGWPIYLETQEPRATKLYARFGFKVLRSDVEIVPGGPTWTMWREPRSNAVRRPDNVRASAFRNGPSEPLCGFD